MVAAELGDGLGLIPLHFVVLILSRGFGQQRTFKYFVEHSIHLMVREVFPCWLVLAVFVPWYFLHSCCPCAESIASSHLLGALWGQEMLIPFRERI